MTHDDDVKRLFAGLDGTADVLRVLADKMEEQGDEIMALGYRWLAENGRQPRLHRDGFGWYEFIGIGNPPDGEDIDSAAVDWDCLKKVCRVEGRWAYCDSRSQAFDAAARAVGVRQLQLKEKGDESA